MGARLDGAERRLHVTPFWTALESGREEESHFLL